MLLIANFAVIAISCLLMPGTAVAAPRQNIFIFGSGTADKAAESRFGADMASGMADYLANQLAIQSDKQFRCQGSLTGRDLQALLGLARERSILGASDADLANALANAGGALGAQYAVRVRVQMNGDQVVVRVSAIDIGRAKVLGMDSRRFAFDGESMDVLDHMAGAFADSLGNSPLRCPGPWHGTVTFKEEFTQVSSRNSYPYEFARTQEAVCSIEREGTHRTRCVSTFSDREKEQCRGGVACGGTRKGKDEALPNVSVEIGNGKVMVLIDTYSIPAVGYSETLGTSNSDLRAGMGGFRVEAPASPDQKSQSGSKTVEQVKTKEITASYTITWSLTRE